MPALPLIKVVALLARQVSKPLANMIKSRAKSHPAFTRFAISSARAYNQLEVRMRRRVLGLKTQNAPVRPLDDETSLDLAADMLGEIVLFGLAGGILYFEYARQKAGEAAKEAELRARFEALEDGVRSLNATTEAMRQHESQLQSNVHELMQHNLVLETVLSRTAGTSGTLSALSPPAAPAPPSPPARPTPAPPAARSWFAWPRLW
eukprot:Unigene8759_Nuclearia_a/m.26817 Unigene8759_Nuclearia_a/g.26817  ORF Unigene8759_Nuclearia_a/g.26817 Unigene8759_Nuclearia_a/m.26817 type:complete len:206 (+) Unigene8759_Nuclearia_a:44-661(+)